MLAEGEPVGDEPIPVLLAGEGTDCLCESLEVFAGHGGEPTRSPALGQGLGRGGRSGQPRKVMSQLPLSRQSVTASDTLSSMSQVSTLSDMSESMLSRRSSMASRRALTGVLDWVSSSSARALGGMVARASLTASRTMGTRASLRAVARASVRRRVMVSCMVVWWCWVGWVSL